MAYEVFECKRMGLESTNLKESSASYETKLNELVQSSQGKQTEMENELVKRVI